MRGCGGDGGMEMNEEDQDDPLTNLKIKVSICGECRETKALNEAYECFQEFEL